MKFRFKKNFSKKKKTVILDNKIDMPKDLYGDTESISLNLVVKHGCEIWCYRIWR